jgi:hypothetical protein
LLGYTLHAVIQGGGWVLIVLPVKKTWAPAAASALATAPPNEPPAPYMMAFLCCSILLLVLMVKCFLLVKLLLYDLNFWGDCVILGGLLRQQRGSLTILSEINNYMKFTQKTLSNRYKYAIFNNSYIQTRLYEKKLSCVEDCFVNSFAIDLRITGL